MRFALGLIALAFLLGAGFVIWDYFGVGGRKPQAEFPETETFRIVTVGTSLTARGAWPETVQATVSDCTNRQIELQRVAKPGARSDWVLAHLDEVIAARPDLVLIEFAINDSDTHDGLWPWQSLANHEAMISELRAGLPQSQIWLLRTSPAFGARGALRFPRPIYRRMYGILAVRHDLGLLDMRPAWRRYLRDHDHREALPDDLHPTALSDQMVTGRVVSDAICAALMENQ